MFPWGKVAVSVTLCTKVHLPREEIGLGLITFRMYVRWRKIRVECRMAGKPLVKGNKWRCITELSFGLGRSALRKDRPMLGRNNLSAGLPDAPLALFSYIHAHFSAHSTAMIKIYKTTSVPKAPSTKMFWNKPVQWGMQSLYVNLGWSTSLWMRQMFIIDFFSSILVSCLFIVLPRSSKYPTT